MQSQSDEPASSTRERLLAILRQRTAAAMFTSDIAGLLGLHPSGVRAHLHQLEAVGLVHRTRIARGRGRPRDAWEASPRTGLTDHDASLPAAGPPAPSDADFHRLAELRAGLRDYLAWGEDRAREHDTTPVQFQLVLAVRASPEPDGPTVGELATALRLKHHSVVGLVDRAESAGMVRRERDADNGARVRVTLTADGQRRLDALAAEHGEKLATIAPRMREVWGAFPPRTAPVRDR